MASSQKAKSGKNIKISSQRKSLPPDEWIVESDDPNLKDKVLCFPTVVVKNYRTSELSTLSLKVLEPMTGPYSRSRIIYEPELHMPVISEYPLPENMHKGDTIKSDRLPSLCAPSYHLKDHLIPKPLVADLINHRTARWGCSLNPRGDIQYLNGFWEWSQRIYRKLLDKGLDELAYAVHAASFDYSRPNSVYRALCEVWCPQTNTFVTSVGEIGISLWEMRHITGLPIRGEYFEEVIPSLTELRNSGTGALPVTCLHLFKAFVLINKKKGDNRPRHSDWLDFWFKDGARASDPKKSKAYKATMTNCFKRDGEFFTKRRLVRPIQVEIPSMKTKVNGDDPFIFLDLDLDVPTLENLEIAAYLALWLCRFVFPSSDDVIRPTIFKTASRMAAGVTYSLVPPIVASIYKGLSETCSTRYDQKNLGMASYTFPGHYFYAWAGLHFPRGVYAEVDKELDRPLLRRFRGTLNAYLFYEEKAKGFRDLLRGSMSSSDFCWQPVPYSGNRGPRRDDGQRSDEISELMISMRGGHVMYRRGSVCVIEMYNPHRFARQHGFHQRLPGTPSHPSIISFDASFLYRAWLSLTRINSGAGFHVINHCVQIESQCDSSYSNWWKDDVLPHLDNINCKTLLASESENFKFKAQAVGLGKGKSLPIVAKAAPPVAKAPPRLRKRDSSKDCLNPQEQPVPKMLKLTVPVSRSGKVRSAHPVNIPESAEVSSSNESDHVLLSSRISKGVFKKQDIDSNRGRISSTIAPVNNPNSPKQKIQEGCQTRATEVEPNLAGARPEDGANHTTTKSPPGRVDSSCNALNDFSTFLELSPRSRNKDFPPLPDLATLNSIPDIYGDQNFDNDIIGALFDDNDWTMSILSGSGEILPLVDVENTNPCEGEVNSKTNPSCTIPVRQEAINNSAMDTLPGPYGHGEARSPRLMPMFSSISGPPIEAITSETLAKKIILTGMPPYLKDEFDYAMKNGFSGLKTWWTSKSSSIEDTLKKLFYVDTDPLMRKMDCLLVRVDEYLLKRHESVKAVTSIERDRKLTAIDSTISAGQFKVLGLNEQLLKSEAELLSLDNEIQRLQNRRAEVASNIDFIRDERQNTEETIVVMEKERVKLQESHIHNVAEIQDVDQMRSMLEKEFASLASIDWVEKFL